ncbi:type 1 glutamine amidotransferase domain-containing protein [uncultured Dokdonia sp.]|uniref:type 1 glutamine amidotransferase domain-containing protein n=1 Tax=uncultured Dokdonia sp. TaxID=575653 RepID=UPI00260174C2|nr:type 1 glutamine amidotransferase domain-containing protein [uncultured Dokdonia sp.]
MSKKRRILKWSLITFLSLLLILFCFGLWFKSLLPPKEIGIENSLAKNLPYLSENVLPNRGKILAIVTSTDTMGTSGKATGYELTELARAYYVFEANGFEVDIASPLGGKPPVIIDDDDMGAYDYAFLNDSIAQYKTSHTIAVEDINPNEYEAVFFAGGKGAMFDFPNNKTIQTIVRTYYQSNKVVGAVCHGPAALVNVVLDNNRPLLENKTISGFTNEEELLLIPDAETIFPFLLQDKLTAQGAQVSEGMMYLEKISHDANLITGQNPWSTWGLAETMIKQLGYTPKYREITAEENAVQVVSIYHEQGTQKAKEMIKKMIITEHKKVNRVLIAAHSIVAVMKGDVGQFYDMIRLVSYTKKQASI